MTMSQINRDIGMKVRLKLAYYAATLKYLRIEGTIKQQVTHLYNVYKWMKVQDWFLFCDKGFHTCSKEGGAFAETDEGKQWIRDFEEKACNHRLNKSS